MNGSFLGLLELVALAYLLVALGISAASAMLYPFLRERLHRVSPADRASWLVALCATPAAGALLLTGLCLLPSAGISWWPAVDHCPDHHQTGHPHLCLAHLPETAGSVAGLVGMAALVLLLAALTTEAIRTAALGRRLKKIAAGNSEGLDEGVGEIESALPMAATVGVFRPRVLVSSRLRESIPKELLAVVCEHEQAHVRRRDPLRKAAAKLFSLLHVPWVRRQMLDDLGLACEQACDEEAAQRSGDRLLVARALLAVERLFSKHQLMLPDAVSAFGGNGIGARVESLVGDAVPRARASARALLPGLLLFLIAMTDRVHHTTETLLGLVTR